MKLKKCYAILGLPYGAGLEDVKRAYRKLAFSLHPDLNPKLSGASRKFQELNEAYVILSKELLSGGSSTGYGAGTSGQEQGPSSEKTREEAQRAYQKAKENYKEEEAPKREEPKEDASGHMDKEEVLKNILNDSFARRVFEDIYSHINDDRQQSGQSSKPREDAGARPGGANSFSARPDAKKYSARTKTRSPEQSKSLFGGIKGWLKKQIDDEQVIRMPGAQLVPGARVRLQISHGLTGEPQSIEITLPPGFVPGKPIRLKGMGRRVGNWHGDLYVRLEPI